MGCAASPSHWLAGDIGNCCLSVTAPRFRSSAAYLTQQQSRRVRPQQKSQCLRRGGKGQLRHGAVARVALRGLLERRDSPSTAPIAISGSAARVPSWKPCESSLADRRGSKSSCASTCDKGRPAHWRDGAPALRHGQALTCLLVPPAQRWQARRPLDRVTPGKQVLLETCTLGQPRGGDGSRQWDEGRDRLVSA